MAEDTRHVLHQIHTATNDVITGYDTMIERAEPEIRSILTELNAMHLRHAADQETRLSALGDSGQDDDSWRGSLNEAVVTLRDWVTGLDENALEAVQRGEQALLDIYDNAMEDWPAGTAPDVSQTLTDQYHEIEAKMGKIAVA